LSGLTAAADFGVDSSEAPPEIPLIHGPQGFDSVALSLNVDGGQMMTGEVPEV
jgi:hypothetical protein